MLDHRLKQLGLIGHKSRTRSHSLSKSRSVSPSSSRSKFGGSACSSSFVFSCSSILVVPLMEESLVRNENLHRNLLDSQKNRQSPTPTH